MNSPGFLLAFDIDEPRTIVALWVQEHDGLPDHHDAQQGVIQIQACPMVGVSAELHVAPQLYDQEFS